MKLTLIRDIYTTKSTVGRLFIDGVEFCYTLEDVARAKGVKIYGETAIPSGKYSVTLSYSNRFKTLMPLVYNKPDLTVRDDKGISFSGIRIHPGNSDKDTHGCILIGSSKSHNFVGNSRTTYKELLNILGDFDILELEIINEIQKK
jgi:hypothetical protein